MSTVRINFDVEEREYRSIKRGAKAEGVTMKEYVLSRVFRDEYEPSAVTKAAMRELKEGKGKRFETHDEFLTWLENI